MLQKQEVVGWTDMDKNRENYQCVVNHCDEIPGSTKFG